MINYTSTPFTDPDGDPLTLSQTGLPAPLMFTDNGDGTYSVTGTAPSGGPWNVYITADDGNGGSATQTLTIDCGTTSAGWDSAQITYVSDFGNADNQTSGTNNGADARLYIGDLSSFGSYYGSYPLGVANGGVIDDVTVNGAPILNGNHHGVAFGDGYITLPQDIPNVTDMRLVHVSGAPFDFADANSGAYTLGSWMPVGTGVWLRAGYAIPHMGAGPPPGMMRMGVVRYEFKYADGTVIGVDCTLKVRNHDGSAPL